MSICDNETSKIYPDLNPMAPQEPQAYRLEKLTEIETSLLDEIEVCGRLAKNMKPFDTITSIVDTVSNQINSYYWRCFHCRICKWCWPVVGTVLSETSLLFFFCNSYYTKIL